MLKGSTGSFNFSFVGPFLLLLVGLNAFGQQDQGTVTGVVEDTSGAVIPGAQVTLTNTDTALVRQAKTDAHGIYVFSPVKIGHYRVSASVRGFQTTMQENLQLNIEERLNVVLVLQPGKVTQTVVITGTPPLLQTQSGSVGQVMSMQAIEHTPLNQNNWVYIAQLAAGVVPSSGTRGGGSGDFEANGQRAEQNNFILDGVDNNTAIPDYMNGSSYAVAPPPDALSEFRVETADYSAEYGRSTGAILSASIKSGTNQIHGDVWEYLRNTSLDAKDWDASSIPPYHMNQFGGTLGLPILKNKLFYFGDIQPTRISYSGVSTLTVPTPLMRQGNLTELLNTSLTGQAKPIQLYQPNSGGGPNGTAKLICGGQNDTFCANQLNPVALRILNLYPMPNANGGKTYNNLVENLKTDNDPIQWDQRMDWNISAKDQAYVTYSYQHIVNSLTPPLGAILDGSPNNAGTQQDYLTQDAMLSETHIFSPTLINEFRFGYNWGYFADLQANDNVNVAATLGIGGMPFNAGPDNGGMPQFSVGGISGFGSHGNDPAIETQNVYEILDNVTKVIGSHSLKAGVDLQAVRYHFQEVTSTRGSYGFNGLYTSIPGQSFTGYGVADFLADQLNSASISNFGLFDYEQGIFGAYVEDNWRVTRKLTVDYGVRYDYFQPRKDIAGQWADFVPTSFGIGTGTGVYLIPSVSKNVYLSPAFTSALQQDHISLEYDPNPRLGTAQKTNFAPRFGFAYQADAKTVVRGGFGMFYGGFQPGGGAQAVENYPFVNNAFLVTPSCTADHACPSLGAQGATLETGLSQTPLLENGITSFVSFPPVESADTFMKTPYTMDYNFSIQRAITNNLAATVAYVGNVSRHVVTLVSSDPPLALLRSGLSTQNIQPFPLFTNSTWWSYQGESNYNSMQTTLEKRYAHGLNFLATYTWSHALDDTVDPLGGGVTDRNTALIPITDEYTNSNYDVRQRFNFDGYYELPFGTGRIYMNGSRLANLIVGGWAVDLDFSAQTGLPFTVTPNISTAAGGSARAIPVGNVFAPGGAPNSTNPSVTCAQQTRTTTNWYNPCAFDNPLPGNTIPVGTEITGVSNLVPYLGGVTNFIYGPGFYRINMSLFKDFITWREQHLEFRADAFNLFNHPTWGNPSTTNINSNGGTITGPRGLQNNTPDARFFQLSLKYIF